MLHWLPSGMRTERYLRGMRQHLANVDGARDERDSCAARVYGSAIDELERRSAAAPVRARGRLLRPARAVDATAAVPRPLRRRTLGGSWPGNVRYQHYDYLTHDAIKRLPAVYGASVTLVDAWLGRFLDRFYASGLPRETIVVLLSDHGILLGDRGWTGKPALELHPELIQVPFMLRDPGGRMAGPDDALLRLPARRRARRCCDDRRPARPT